MWLLAIIALVAIIALAGCALGKVWGPFLVGLGFAGWGALVLLSSLRSPWPEAGLLYLCGSVVEFAAAGEFLKWSGTEKRPPLGWRVMATLLGVAGSLLAMVLFALLAVATISMFSMDAFSPDPFYSPPVYVYARGEASARLDGVTGFTTHTGSADCSSGPGSLVVATVDVWDAGEMQGAMYRGDLHMHMDAPGVDPDTVGVSVYFWSSSMTGPWPGWQGQGRLVTDEPSAGRVVFERMALVTGGQPAAGTWPAELSGEISWSCDPWSSAPATRGP